jgi:hypothetical protein
MPIHERIGRDGRCGDAKRSPGSLGDQQTALQRGAEGAPPPFVSIGIGDCSRTSVSLDCVTQQLPGGW